MLRESVKGRNRSGTGSCYLGVNRDDINLISSTREGTTLSVLISEGTIKIVHSLIKEKRNCVTCKRYEIVL